MLAKLRRFIRDDNGATAIEYGMIAALIAAVIIGLLVTIGERLETAFTTIRDAL